MFLNADDPEGDQFRVGAVRALSDPADANATVALTSTSLDGLTIQGLYGELTIGADGSYRYVIDNENPLVNGLAAEERSLADVFIVSLVDSIGQSGEQRLSIQILGTDDGPISIGEI